MKRLPFLFATLLVWGCNRSGSPEGQGIVLTSPKGKQFVGEQLAFFDVAQEGIVNATRDSWINLYYTEGKPFGLSGEVWLGGYSDTGPAAQDFPDGFALFLREWDSMHRYSLTPGGMQSKRRKHSGREGTRIAKLISFKAPLLERWIPFNLEAREESISFQIGGQGGSIPGPLEMDGANKIVLGMGTKVRALRLELLNH